MYAVGAVAPSSRLEPRHEVFSLNILMILRAANYWYRHRGAKFESLPAAAHKRLDQTVMLTGMIPLIALLRPRSHVDSDFSGKHLDTSRPAPRKTTR